MIIAISILLFAGILWMATIVLVKNKAKLLLDKYDKSLRPMESNNTIKIVRELQELNEKKTLREEDIVECKRIIAVIKLSFFLIPALISFAIGAKVLTVL